MASVCHNYLASWRVCALTELRKAMKIQGDSMRKKIENGVKRGKIGSVKKEDQRKMQMRVTDELREQIKLAVARSDATQDAWMTAAITMYLHEQGGPLVDSGPHAGLSFADRKRAEAYVRFLRSAPEQNKVAADGVIRAMDRAEKAK